MSQRRTIVVDVETTGLDLTEHSVVELAAVDLDTRREIVIVPPVSRYALGHASPQALTVNRYYERRLYEQALAGDQLREKLRELAGWLDGARFAGCNPAFDAAFVRDLYTDNSFGEPPTWHHRLADLSAMTAPVMQPDNPLDLPGLADCCRKWGVENTGPHTALGDARATAECFRRLRAACRASCEDTEAPRWHVWREYQIHDDAAPALPADGR